MRGPLFAHDESNILRVPVRMMIACLLLVMTGILPAGARPEIPSTARSRRAIARVTPLLMPDLQSVGLTLGSPVFIRIFKKERELELWMCGDAGYVPFRTYAIAGMSGGLGPKERRGDFQAPEGFYFLTPDRLNPASSYHLSFDVGYPNALDRALNRTGSLIMIHGNDVSIGCFAMTDEKIEEIYALVDAAFRNGQKIIRIHSFPFRMTREAMEETRDSRHHSFWLNLKEGYDFFESSGEPPDVTVRDGRYVFGTAPAGCRGSGPE